MGHHHQNKKSVNKFCFKRFVHLLKIGMRLLDISIESMSCQSTPNTCVKKNPLRSLGGNLISKLIGSLKNCNKHYIYQLLKHDSKVHKKL